MTRATALALLVLLAAPAALAVSPLRPPANALANGGFEACAERDVALLAQGPDGLAGRAACPPWTLRRGVPGALPLTRSEGAIQSAGRAGVLRVTYDARDGAVLLDQPLPPAWEDPERVTFEARAHAPVTLGFRVEVDAPGGGTRLVPALGSPVTLPGDGAWHRVELDFPATAGRIRSAGFEVHPGTPHGTTLEIDRAVLAGAALREA